MENSLKGLILAAGTIITCLVISLGFFIAKEAKASAMSGASLITSINAEFIESDKIIYDGAQISGSEVINAIQKFSNEDNLAITVQTNKTTKNYNYSYNSSTGEISPAHGYDAMIGVTNADYINPAGRFNGSILRDINGAIIGLKFVQIIG